MNQSGYTIADLHTYPEILNRIEQLENELSKLMQKNVSLVAYTQPERSSTVNN